MGRIIARFDSVHLVCDVLINGGGPAGLWTAQALRGSGLTVVLADDQPAFSGTLKWEPIDAPSLETREVTARLAADPCFQLLPSTFVTGAYENNFFTLLQSVHDGDGVAGEVHWNLRARYVVLASGMIEQPLLFNDNDRPGIMLSSAVHRLIGEYAVAPARRIAFYTNNDSAYATALVAHRAGLDVAAIIDTRPQRESLLRPSVQALGIPCHFASEISSTRGYRRLAEVAVRSNDGRMRRIPCDGLGTSGGWLPSIHLAAHRGVRPQFDESLGGYRCSTLPRGWFAVGGLTAPMTCGP